MARETNTFGVMLSGNEDEREQMFGSVKVGFAGNLLSGELTPQKRATRLKGMHTELTRLHWLRTALEDALKGVTITPCYGEDCGKTAKKDKRAVWLKLDPPVDLSIATPWSPHRVMNTVGLFSLDNSKMSCPSFALPAGALATGGTCPGADPGQTSVDEAHRKTMAKSILPILKSHGANPKNVADDDVDLITTICDSCYATGGQFQYSDNQFSEIVRFAWLTHASQEQIIAVLNAGIEGLKESGWHEHAAKDAEKYGGKMGLPDDVKFFRLHDSGDFFLKEPYATAWIEVAKLHPDVYFWAPTRTWVLKGWRTFWEDAGVPKNLIIRPSAYHFEDKAPRFPASSGMAAGSTSLFALGKGKHDKTAAERPEYADWNCHVYAIQGDDAKSCVYAENPVGGTHCRACWIAPDKTINYSAH
jgi:hypothetical protein